MQFDFRVRVILLCYIILTVSLRYDRVPVLIIVICVPISKTFTGKLKKRNLFEHHFSTLKRNRFETKFVLIRLLNKALFLLEVAILYQITRACFANQPLSSFLIISVISFNWFKIFSRTSIGQEACIFAKYRVRNQFSIFETFIFYKFTQYH